MRTARKWQAHPTCKHVFKRFGSDSWTIRVRDADGKRVVESLGTSDARQAEIIALPKISEHKARLAALRPRLRTIWQHRLEPGREHAAPEGGKIVATDRELIHIGHNGAITKTEPNGGLADFVAWPEGTRPTLNAIVDAAQAVREPRPTVATKSGDDAILETYLSDRGIVGYDRKEAETVFAVYKQLTDNKPFRDATRADGKLLAQHFKDSGNKTATIVKKVGWLRAAVQLAIDEDKTGRLTFNPFSNVVAKPKDSDETERLPLDDADMKKCRASLDNLDKPDALLFRVLATTGMRLSEAYQIAGEATERGVRYVIVGEKTEQSKRRVPLPAALLPHLPKKITDHLFGDDTRANHRLASKRLNRFLNDCGIVDRRKVIHSLRHRAQDRLRAAGAPQDIREALLGHSKVTVGEGYGVGFPVPMLRKWVDKIGF